MKEIRRDELASNFDAMMPIVITSFELISPEAQEHDVLSKFKQNEVYKAYKDKKGYYLFPEREGDHAYYFKSLEESNEHFAAKLAVVTRDNFHEFIDLLDDENIDRLTEMLDKPIESEIDERAAKELEDELNATFTDKVMEQVSTVSGEESAALFNHLNKQDPMLSRALFEFGKYVSHTLASQKGLDKASFDVMNDRTLGKGAYITKAMENILRYSKSNEPTAFSHVLKTGLYSLIEMKRNL